MRIRDIKISFIVFDEKQEVFCGQKVLMGGVEIGKITGAEFLESGYGTRIDAEITAENYFNTTENITLEKWIPKINGKGEGKE